MEEKTYAMNNMKKKGTVNIYWKVLIKKTRKQMQIFSKVNLRKKFKMQLLN